MARSEKSPFDVQLDETQRRELTTMLCEAIRTGLQARDRVMGDNGLIDFAYSLYEQERQSGLTRDAKSGGADLTSPIGTENVDGLSSRAAKTVFLDPLWIVEGKNKTSKPKAPAVEEYMQMRQEEMRLQSTANRWFDAALIEEGSIIEVCEDTEPILCTEVLKVGITRNAEDIALDPRGSIVVDEKGQPVPLRDAKGGLVPAEGRDEYVEVRREYWHDQRQGASLRLHSMKDFLWLPGHVKDQKEAWGQAFRFWMPLHDLRAAAARDEYDAEAVESLGESQERDTRAEHTRGNQDVEVDHAGAYVDKELWRLQIKADLDGKGKRYYIVTVSLQHNAILRIKYDWLTLWRGVYANPYPRTYSIYGYSVILGKLLTTIEEHTGWRNMNADRGTLKASTPMKVLKTEDWDPELQPWGTFQTIRVSSMDGIQPFDVPDISQGGLDRERTCVMDAQRIIGMNDIALGQVSTKARTLGENEMASRESFTRTDRPIGLFQEAMEDLGALIYEIEMKALEEMEDGREATDTAATRLGQRGLDDFDGTFTSELLRGKYRFKPRGSVESADPQRRQQVLIYGLDVLQKWGGSNPHLQQRLQSPEFANALLQMWVTEFKPRDAQAFLAPMSAPPQLPPGQLPPGAPPAEGAPRGEGAAGPSFGGDELLAQLAGALPGGRS